jgi:hypothetical protein
MEMESQPTEEKQRQQEVHCDEIQLDEVNEPSPRENQIMERVVSYLTSPLFRPS